MEVSSVYAKKRLQPIHSAEAPVNNNIDNPVPTNSEATHSLLLLIEIFEN